MKTFHCDHCQHLVFFENVRCVRCDHVLAFVPERGAMTALVPERDNIYRPVASAWSDQRFRLCANYVQENVCNWAVPAESAERYCRSCRLSRTIPDLADPANRRAWVRLETAKRRLIYTLLDLELPVEERGSATPHGLAFDFLADQPGSGARVLTGHQEGVITLNIAEADDSERERRRESMHEPYRTILGHFRHEIGHYYWDRLIKDSAWLEPFRQAFGDEQQDYAQALQKHHQQGPPSDWQEQFVSAYASSHPWEDWAESWAHYLHIVDTLDTAVESGLSMKPRRPDEPALRPSPRMTGAHRRAFDPMIDGWFALTYVLNNLNRGMGLLDAYPFVLSGPAVEKLRFIHDVISNPEAVGLNKRPKSDHGVTREAISPAPSVASVS